MITAPAAPPPASQPQSPWTVVVREVVYPLLAALVHTVGPGGAFRALCAGCNTLNGHDQSSVRGCCDLKNTQVWQLKPRAGMLDLHPIGPPEIQNDLQVALNFAGF